MRIKTHAILSDKIEEGIRYGLNRGEKYGYCKFTDTEGSTIQYNMVVEQVHQAVMNSISEYFDWNDEACWDEGR